MKHLFFVAVAVGIFPGTLISAKAQSSVNTVKPGNSIPAKKSTQFIEGIEIKDCVDPVLASERAPSPAL